MEEQINALINENKMLAERLSNCEQMIVACMEQINSTNKMLTDEIINPISDAFLRADDEYKYGEFSQKYGERLAPYSEKLSAIEGRDVDAIRNAYDAYKSYSDEERSAFDSDEVYIDGLITELDDYINKVRETLGVSADTPVEVSSDESGEMQIAVNGEPIAEAEKEEVVAEVETEEQPKEEEKEEVEVEEDENTKFYNELMRDRAKYMR